MNRGQGAGSGSQRKGSGHNKGRNQNAYHEGRRQGRGCYGDDRPSANRGDYGGNEGQSSTYNSRGQSHRNTEGSESRDYHSRGRSSNRRGRKRQYNHQAQHSSGSSQRSFSGGHCSTSQQESQSSEGNNELDIPGFVYDKEKKRYFKIAPNHSQNPYTKDAIAKRAAEAKRQRDLDELDSKKQIELCVNKRRHLIRKNFGFMLQERPVSDTCQREVESAYLRTTVSSLRPLDSQHLFNVQQLGQYENLEHAQTIKLWKDHSSLCSLWTLKRTWIQRVQLVNIEEAMRTKDRQSLAVNAVPSLCHKITIFNKVTDMCWAQLNNNEMMHVLFTTICHTGTLHSLAVLSCLEESAVTFQEFNLGRKATWACAWNRHKQQFSVGSEKCSLLVNVERRTMFEYKANNSDPLTQVFSHQTGNYFYTGTRKGEILVFDCRGHSSMPTNVLRHKSSVCSLNLLQNDHHLIAADFTGKVHLWDLRQRKVVIEYPGNVNQYTKLPVHVDEKEELLYTVGEDGYTRFWDLKQGTPLHTLPPPCPVSRETIPCVQLSTRWGNSPGNTGLIMGMENKLYMYGKLPER